MSELPIQPKRSLHVSAGFAAYLSMVQATPGIFRQYLVESPAIICVRHGKKTIETEGRTLEMLPGENVFLPEGLECAVTNDVGSEGRYHAEILSFTAEFVAQLSPTNPTLNAPIEPQKLTIEADFDEAFSRASRTLCDDTPEPLQRHIVGEIVLRLRGLGIEPLVTRGNRLILNIRGMVGQDMAREWRSDDFAKALAMSEQTLRRRLADAGTTLTETIAEARLQTALTLLQSTDMPITTIALDCGYQSPSKFAARFRSRYGLAPSEIRSRQIERIGA